MEQELTFWGRQDDNNMHGDIVGRKLQTKRIQFSIQRASGAHNNPFNPSLFLKRPSQLINSISPKSKWVSLHRFIVHFPIIIRYVVVYRPSLQFRRRSRIRITRLQTKKLIQNSRSKSKIFHFYTQFEDISENFEPLVSKSLRIWSKRRTASSIRSRENRSGGGYLKEEPRV